MGDSKSTSFKPRLLKICGSYYEHNLPSDSRSCPKPVPMLRLRGHWLGAAGFVVGQQVEVHVGEKRITITKKR